MLPSDTQWNTEMQNMLSAACDLPSQENTALAASVADSGGDSLTSLSCVRYALRLPVKQSVADTASSPQLDSTRLVVSRLGMLSKCGAAS